MSENLNVFPNAKSKILGDDTHAASLTGSDTHAAVLNGSNITTVDKPAIGAQYAIVNPNINIIWGQTETVIAAKGIIVTSTKNFLILDVTCGIQYNTTPGTRTGRVRIRLQDLNGAILAFTDIPDGAFGFLHLAVNEQDIPISTTQVVFTIENNTTFTDPGTRSAILFFPSVVNIDDTHSASLSGANTQAAVLTGDNTQTTHEQAVLPS